MDTGTPDLSWGCFHSASYLNGRLTLSFALACTQLCLFVCVCPHHGVVLLWQIGPNSNATRCAALQLESTSKTGRDTAI